MFDWGIVQSPDRADRDRGLPRPHESPEKPAYTRVKHPDMKKLKTEGIEVGA